MICCRVPTVACLQVPSPTENTIRYLSMHDNKYMRYFRGHTEEVTSLDISPNSDAFLSAAKVGSALCLVHILTPAPMSMHASTKVTSPSSLPTAALVRLGHSMA